MKHVIIFVVTAMVGPKTFYTPRPLLRGLLHGCGPIVSAGAAGPQVASFGISAGAPPVAAPGFAVFRLFAGGPPSAAITNTAGSDGGMPPPVAALALSAAAICFLRLSASKKKTAA